MRIGTTAAACLVVGGLLAFGQATPGWAQDSTRGRFGGALAVGLRGYATEPDPLERGKFEEYRDMRAGPLVEQLLLKFTPADSFGVYSVSARNLLRRDQSMWLQAKRPGDYDFQIRWDRIPHTYSTTARSPGDEFNPGFNALPVPRPDSLAWRSAPYIDPVRSQWDPVKLSLGLTPNEQLDFKGEYMRIGKSGGIPQSLSYSGSAGPQREFVAPIDQAVHDLRLSQGFASGERAEGGALSFVRGFQLLASYSYSRFLNDIKSTMVDNPQLSVSTFATGVASARASMPPDNTAQSATLTGALALPARTRVMGTVSLAWLSQDDAFFEQTSNDSLRRDPNYGLVALPRASLDGRVRTSVVNLSATSSPLSALSLAARFRRYERKDRTAPFHLQAMVISDRTIALADSETREPDPFTKSNAELSASYRLLQGLSATVGYAIENWSFDPEVRNVGETKEKGPRASLDFNGVDWLTLHASHGWARRRGDEYTRAATEIIGFRRFDLSDRDRERTNLLATVTPVASLDLSVSYQLGDDQFPNSQYGTQSDKSTAKGVDAEWTPIGWLTLSAGHEREDVQNVLNSRYRTGAVGSVTDDNPTYKWTNTNTDRNSTTYASVRAALIPDRLDLMGSLSNIDAHFWVYNVNPTTPTGGTPTNNLNATVEDWPEVTQNLKPFLVALRYRHSDDWAVTARYQGERYSQTDFRTSMPLFAPFITQTGALPGSIGTVAGSNTGQYHFLGSRYLPYTANWFTLLISYRPASIPFMQGRSAL